MSQANHIEEIYKEAAAMKKLNHKNIVTLYHAFVDGNQAVMVMEYAGGGELLAYVQNKGTLSELEARNIF